VREETGVSVEITRLVGIYSDPRHVIVYSDGEVRQQFNICFRARPIAGTAHRTDEASEVRWVHPKDFEFGLQRILDGIDALIRTLRR
jgi:ADP-ribose pyrophosphatase YjhB (NUDIX family)